MKKVFSTILLFLITLSSIFPLSAYESNSVEGKPYQNVDGSARFGSQATWTVDDNGPADFISIQAAINAASNNDKILVKVGSYVENVVINKSISLLGADPINTIIEGNLAGNVLSINAINVTINGFTIRGKGTSDYSNSGIYVPDSLGNNITNNIVKNNYYGILLVRSSNNTVETNNLSNNAYNLFLFSSGNNSISKNNVKNSNCGIFLSTQSSNNSIIRNNLTANSNGIVFYVQSNNNVISECNITDSQYGASFDIPTFPGAPIDSDNNIFSLNTFRNNIISLELTGSEHSISGNKFENNSVGMIFQQFAVSNTLRNNVFSNNTVNLDAANAGFFGKFGYQCGINDIDSSNSIEGKPVYYWVGQTNKAVPIGAGYIALVHCTNITVQNQNLSGNGQGIWLAYTENSTITNCTFAQNNDGIYLYWSSHINISSNKIFSNRDQGIDALNSSQNIIQSNQIANSTTSILLAASCNNSISMNTIANSSDTGISFSSVSYPWGPGGESANNSAIANNFVGNTINVLASPNSPNRWDDGYSRGNYWSNYGGVDSNGDGVGDTPQIIDAVNMDNFPLMAPWVPRSSLGLDGVVSWLWGINTTVNSQVAGDIDGDGAKELVTGGYYFDGVRKVAQLCVWNGNTRALENIRVFYWTGNTVINSIALGDVDGDSQVEVVTGGTYFDGSRNVAQLCVWNGATLALENIRVWYWSGNTVIQSLALGNVDGDGQVEIVTGGTYFDGTRNVAQLCVWSGATLALENIRVYYWTGNTLINSLVLGDADSDGLVEIITGGSYFDGVNDIAQLCVWSGLSLALENIKVWYWYGNTRINSVALDEVDGDGSLEVVTGGTFSDGVKESAQLIVFTGSSLILENLRVWRWSSDSITSVVLGEVDFDSSVEIITGTNYESSGYSAAQLVVWSGSSLTVKSYYGWQWSGSTAINSIYAFDVDGDGAVEVGTGGYCSGNIAQFTTWEMR